MCIFPTLRSISYANNPLPLDQRSFPKRTINSKCPRKAHGYRRENKQKEKFRRL